MAQFPIPKVTDTKYSLNDFNNDHSQEGQYSLSDFRNNLDEVAPVGNRASNVNAAAYSASMNFDPTDILDSYNRTLSEMETSGVSPTMTSIVSKNQEVMMNAYKKDIYHLLADPTLTDEQKQAAVKETFDYKSKLYDPINMVLTAGLSAPVEDETKEQANQRLNTSDLSFRLAQNKKAMQEIYNSHVNMNNPTWVGKVADFAVDFLLPAGDSVAASRIRADQDGSAPMAFVKTLFASGSSMATMRQRIVDLPLDQQPAAAKALADIISTHSGITPFTQNNISKMELLKSMISPDAYTSDSAWKENIGGIFDLAMSALTALPVVGAGVKSVKGGLDIADAVRASGGLMAPAKSGKADLLNFEQDFKANYESMASRFKGTYNKEPFGPAVDVESEMFKRGLKEKVAEWLTSMPKATGLEADIQSAIEGVKTKRRTSQEVDIATAIKKWEKEKPTEDSLKAGIEAAIKQQEKTKVSEKPTTLEEQLAEEIRLSQASKASQTSDLEGSLAEDISKWTEKQKLESNMARDVAANETQPASLSQVMKDANPDKAKAMHQMAALDTSEGAAEALYGTSRAEAIAHDILPQVGHADGSVGTRVPNIDAVKATEPQVPQSIKDLIDNDGKIQYSDGEKAGTRAWMENKFREAFGSFSRPEMSQVFPHMDFKTTDSGFIFRNVIGPNTSNPKEALDMARHAARNTGISDSSMTLLRREGDQFVPTTLEKELARPALNSAGEPANDYLVSFDHKFVMEAGDVARANKFEPLSVKYNMLDRHHLTDGSEGTLNMMLIDPASMFDPIVSKSAFQGVDRESGFGKALLSMVKDFADGFNKLKKDRQSLVLNEIHEANLNRRDYDLTRLLASGANPAEIKVLQDFKKFHDTVWYLDNKNLVSNLKNQGYLEFIDNATDTKELVKRAVNGAVTTKTNIYDHATNSIKHLTQEEINSINKTGGFAKLRNSFKNEAGDIAEYVVYTNSANGSYLRELGSGTQALRYLPGYYKIHYDSPYFVIETLKDKKGNQVYSRAVAPAKDIPSAKLVVDAKNRTAEGDRTYSFRRANEDAELGVEYDTDVMLNRGNYRRRGQLLQDVDSPQDSLDKAYIRSPIESMVNATRRVARNTAMGDVISAQEGRIASQWGHLLPKVNGKVQIPRNLKEIKRDPTKPFIAREVGDARSSVAYANALRYGYENHIDDAYKAMWKWMGEALGDSGFGTLQRASNAMAAISPTNSAKGAVFTALLALNPIRQVVVQGSQVTMLVAVNPKWVATTGTGQIMYLALRQAGVDVKAINASLAPVTGMSVKELDQMWKEFNLTGMAAGIDRQNMASGAVHDAAQRMVDNLPGNVLHNIAKFPRNIVTIGRTLGFDAGEFVSTAGSWAAFRDLAVKAGKDLSSPAVRNEIAAQARNYTGSMNRGGDLPQNQNSLASIFQFTQNMHKMVLGATTNRINSPLVRASMGISAVTLYGLPTAVVFSPLLVSLPPEWKQRLYVGLEGWLLNKTAEISMGENPELDFSSFNPFNVYGEVDLIHSIWTTSPGEIIANTPAGSLLFGRNPRLAKFLKTAAQYTNIVDDDIPPHQFVDVATDFCKIASGCSNVFKARFALATSKKISNGNNITDQYVSKFAAAATLAGIPTIDESLRIDVNNKNYAKSQEFQDDVKTHYKHWKQWVGSQSDNEGAFQYWTRMNSNFYRAYGNDNPAAREVFNKLLHNDMANGDGSMFRSVIRNSPYYSDKSAEQMVDEAPFENPQDRETIKAWMKMGNDFTNTREKGK